MKIPPTLLTPRLRLRRWHAHDLDALVAIKIDPENWRFIADGEPRTREDAARNFAEFQGEWPTHGIGRWAVEERANGELLGDCGVVLTDPGPQLAYMIKRSNWGQGFATEASRAVLGYVFHTFEWSVVFASTHPENAASRRVLEKLGMVLHERQTPRPDLSAGSSWNGALSLTEQVSKYAPSKHGRRHRIIAYAW